MRAFTLKSPWLRPLASNKSEVDKLADGGGAAEGVFFRILFYLVECVWV